MDQLKSNVEALSLVLTKEDIDEIEKASPIDLGFPHTLIGMGPGDSFMNRIGGHVDYVEHPKVCLLYRRDGRIIDNHQALSPRQL